MTGIAPLPSIASAGDPFVHPGGAYRIQPPEGYAPHAFVDERGVPVHVFTPDAQIDSPDGIVRGMWVYAFPIPTDDQLDASNVSELISRLLTAKDPKLTVHQKTKVDAQLGSLKAVAMVSEGTRAKTGPWKGRVLIAVQDDSYLVCSYGGPPAEWDSIRAACEAALKTLAAPVKLSALNEPPIPAQPQRARDVSDMLTRATPMVNVRWRKQAKDEGTLGPIGSSGSGFIITADGYVITNRHVVESASQPSGFGRVAYDPVVLTWDRTTNQPPIPADVVAISYQYDLALLKIRDGSDGKKWTVAPLADITNVRLGDKLLVAGWPAPDRFGEAAMNLNDGALTAINRDGHGRPEQLRHGARTTHGNSGGPVYDLDIGAIVGVHYLGLFMESDPDAAGNPLREVLFYAAVPVHRIVWEFPQIIAGQMREQQHHPMPAAERRALIAYYYLQQRYGAAMIECRRALADDPQDGLANAYMYRIYQSQRDEGRAEACLDAALADPASKTLVMEMASQALLENSNYVDATMWAAKLYQLDPYAKAGRRAMARCYGLGAASGAAVRQWMSVPSNEDLKFDADPEMQAILGRSLVQQWIYGREVRSLPSKNAPFKTDAVDARLALNRAMELWPGNRGICYAHLAILAAQSGEQTKASTLRDRAIRAGAKDLDTRLTLGQFDLLCGNLDEATEDLTAAFRIKATPQAYFLNGWFLAQLADREERAQRPADAQRMRNNAYALLVGSSRVDLQACKLEYSIVSPK